MIISCKDHRDELLMNMTVFGTKLGNTYIQFYGPLRQITKSIFVYRLRTRDTIEIDNNCVYYVSHTDIIEFLYPGCEWKYLGWAFGNHMFSVIDRDGLDIYMELSD